jgi:DNA-binding response OmpR family regulator
MRSMRILVVEDEAELAAAVAAALEAEAYAVDRAADGAAADELMTVHDYDLVVLDWSIPPPSGLELLAAWRQRGLEVPVLMLTGRGGLDDRVSGLDSGADDYLTKPFAYAELLARVRTLLRRREKAVAPLVAGDVELDRAARRVTVGGEPVRLTPKELAVLEVLLRGAGEAVSRQALAEHAWDHTFDAASNTLDVIVSRLRRKIDGGRGGRLIETVPGVGWRLSRERR